MNELSISFVKYTGSGNDFVIIDDREDVITDVVYQEITELICNRNFGIGGDGIMVIKPSSDHDFRMLYFNSDGSPAGMCGNGGRCLADYYMRLTEKTTTKFITKSGTYTGKLLKNGHVQLGLIDPYDLDLEPKVGFEATYLNTGTQHLVVTVSNLAQTDVAASGRNLRFHQGLVSKGGANINFIQKVDNASIAIRTYEKGVEGETLACGTGTVAGAIVAYLKGLVAETPVKVKVKSGEWMEVGFTKDLKKVTLTGPVSLMFSGNMNLVKSENQWKFNS